MNGRLIFSMLGVSILILNLLYQENHKPFSFKTFICVLFGLLLTNVSSGTFTVSFMIFLIWLFINYFEISKLNRRF